MISPEDEFFDEETGTQYYTIDVAWGEREFPVCDGCCAEHDLELCRKLPSCAADMREDGIPIIWVEAKHKIEDE